MKSSSKIQQTSDFLSVGHVKGAHGIRGEVFAHIPSGEWGWAAPGSSIVLKPRALVQKNSQTPIEVTIERFRPHKTGLVIKFKEVPDRNRAEELRGYVLMIPHGEFVSDPGEEIYLNEVLGFEVREALPNGRLIGAVTNFMETGAHDILVVTDAEDSKKEHLIPFVEAFIPDIDFEKKVITVELPEGLLE